MASRIPFREAVKGEEANDTAGFIRNNLQFSIVFVLFFGLLLGALGLDYFDETDLAQIPGQPTQMPAGKVKLIIKVQERLLEVYCNDALYKKYRVAVGKQETPTPIGEWRVVWKDYNWGTGFGTRWMGLNVPWGIYGIHGTNKPWSIGRYASHGCIRMRNRDVEELFEWVPIGTEVVISGPKVRVQRRLKLGSTGPDVVLLQLRMKEMGFFEGRADGIFGSGTEAAVKLYQASQGVEANGIVDRVLVERLKLDG